MLGMLCHGCDFTSALAKSRGPRRRGQARGSPRPQELLVGFQKLEKVAKRLESLDYNLTTPDGSALN